TWGETDGLKLLDFVNATDFRHFIIDDMEDSKIPEFMTNITYYFNQNWNLQFLWIPLVCRELSGSGRVALGAQRR
ncbi:MAG TPA: hypothetical protein PKV48_07275, partial [Thermodesulfobacteriota bacterium]|nr:hypothetical protein [Thermodesulfobacteriota bacterium]